MQIVSNLSIMNFLADSILASQSDDHLFQSVAELEKKFKTYFADETDGSQVFKDIYEELTSINSVENLHSLIDPAKDLLEVDANLSQNEVTGPFRFCGDSFLGMFVRTISVKWELLDFEETCEVLDRLNNFMIQNHTQSKLKITVNSSTLPYVVGRQDLSCIDWQPKRQSSLCREQQEKQLGDLHLKIQLAMKTGDVALAEDHIHRYFDFNGSDPLESLDTFANKAINGGASASASAADTTASISRIVSSMLALQAPFPRAELYASALSASRQLHPQGSPHASSTNTSTYIHRHQHAMITLATMWTLSGNYSMALSAVEEAMNTAHQREDHHSVTKALLLMFHIFKGGHAEELLAGAEDILVRCLKRCKALQMHRQISEIALLLAECRSRGPLKLSYRLSSER